MSKSEMLEATIQTIAQANEKQKKETEYLLQKSTPGYAKAGGAIAQFSLNAFQRAEASIKAAEIEAKISQQHNASDQLWRNIMLQTNKRTEPTRQDAELLEKWIDYQIMLLKGENPIDRREYYKQFQTILG
ncbi:MAG: hypothetical protein EZS28_000578 [Streblomastix strix]|uniref:Uncharacterized protein n=1 Tax=Streblomastix strix TaxID=222440 RepID=A0A5J4X9C2_9EUKA|nr:MAG: hypothetical protein EZS28_000578 [Streblomastix strix]